MQWTKHDARTGAIISRFEAPSPREARESRAHAGSGLTEFRESAGGGGKQAGPSNDELNEILESGFRALGLSEAGARVAAGRGCRPRAKEQTATTAATTAEPEVQGLTPEEIDALVLTPEEIDVLALTPEEIDVLALTPDEIAELK